MAKKILKTIIIVAVLVLLYVFVGPYIFRPKTDLDKVPPADKSEVDMAKPADVNTKLDWLSRQVESTDCEKHDTKACAAFFGCFLHKTSCRALSKADFAKKVEFVKQCFVADGTFREEPHTKFGLCSCLNAKGPCLEEIKN